MTSSNWAKVLLCDILTESNETPDPSLIDSGSIRLISKIRFSDGGIEFRNDGKTKTKMILIQPGNLVLSGINAMKGAIGIYNPEEPIPAAATIHYSAYYVNKDKVDILFLWLLLRSSYFQEILSQQVPQGIKTELKANRLLSVSIPLPDLDEQRRIVSQITALLGRISEAKWMLAETSKELGYLIQSSLSKELCNYPLTRCFEEFFLESPRNGLSLDASKIQIVVTPEKEGIPFIKLGAVSFGMFRDSEVKLVDIELTDKSPFWIQTNDLLMGRGNSKELVGRLVHYKGEPNLYAFPDLIIRLRVDSKKMLPEFVEWYMKSNEVREYIETKATGTSPTMKKVSQPIIAVIPFPDIDLDQQAVFINKMDFLRSKVGEMLGLIEKSTHEMITLSNAIINRAFSGALK